MTRSFAGLTLLWIALWGEVSSGTVAAGLALAFALELAFPTGARIRNRIRMAPGLAFGLHMLWSIVVSSLRVMAAVLRPTPERIAVKMIDVGLTSMSPSVVSITINTISLTPGTLTVDHDRDTNVITVHVLGDVDEEEFRAQMLDHERRVSAFLVARTTYNGGER